MDNSASGKTEWMNVSYSSHQVPLRTLVAIYKINIRLCNVGRRRWINYGSQNLRKDTVVSSLGFLSASCIPGLELKKPATERNAERWRQNNSDNNSSSSNETQLKQKEKSALSNVRIKNDKTEKVFCMTALLQPSSMERKKKKRIVACPPPRRPSSPPPPPLPRFHPAKPANI